MRSSRTISSGRIPNFIALAAAASREMMSPSMRGLLILALMAAFASTAFPQGAAGPISRPRPRPTVKSDAPLLYYDGFLVSMESHQVEIETLSQRRVICRLTQETEYTTYPSEFAPGDRIGVTTASGREDDCVAAWLGRPGERFQQRRKAAPFQQPPQGALAQGFDGAVQRLQQHIGGNFIA